ncbi:MAG: hypothetical protein IIW17_07750 [Clostridia bacterium]|nr:hypothetical protein [Clostridia bacterium]MBQ5793898.1 hypothetical protein [Clostridia bacterium]
MFDTRKEQQLFSYLLEKSLDMFEQARVMECLCKEFSFTQASLAAKLKVSQSYVGNKLRLLQYSEQERAFIKQHGLSERHARAVLKLPSHNRASILTSIVNMNCTVQQTEELIEQHLNLQTSRTANTNTPILTKENFLLRLQSQAMELQKQGYQTTCLTESGDSWARITVTIVDSCFT